MYRRYQEQIVASKAPEYGLKGEFQVVDGYALFWV